MKSDTDNNKQRNKYFVEAYDFLLDGQGDAVKRILKDTKTSEDNFIGYRDAYEIYIQAEKRALKTLHRAPNQGAYYQGQGKLLFEQGEDVLYDVLWTLLGSNKKEQKALEDGYNKAQRDREESIRSAEHPCRKQAARMIQSRDELAHLNALAYYSIEDDFTEMLADFVREQKIEVLRAKSKEDAHEKER